MKFNRVAGMFLLLLVIDFIIYAYQPLGENFFILSDMVVVLLALLAVVCGIYAYKPHGFGSMQGKAILFITLGTFLWFMGELLWAFYEIVLGIEAPLGSMADLSWILGYPLLMIGFYYVYRVASPSFSTKKKIIILAVLAAITLPITYISIPALSSEMTIIEKVSTAGYVIGDLLLLCALIVAVAALWGSRFARSWGLILFSVALTSIADIYYMNISGAYETGSLIDILWNSSYIVMALGFLYHRQTLKSVMQSLKPDAQSAQNPPKTATKKTRK